MGGGYIPSVFLLEADEHVDVSYSRFEHRSGKERFNMRGI